MNKKQTKLFCILLSILIIVNSVSLLIPSVNANTIMGNITAINSSSYGTSTTVQYFIGPYTATANGLLDKLYIYFSNDVPFNIQGALYTDNLGSPNQLIASNNISI